ncbi:MAG: S8 family peptidase, partial [Stackebrandtia sp.]
DQEAAEGDKAYTYPDNAGEGVTAYILDTGIDVEHPDFGGRATAGHDSTGEGPGDGHGHGTHVSGTVAGETFGLAKAASLVEVKVLDSAGSGTYEGVIEGIEWVTENHDGPSVANMSLGGPFDQSVNDAVTASVESGVTYGIAAGNGSGDDSCSYSPGSTPEAITVAASSEGDTLADFSSVGECVDIIAPGEDITSSWPGGGDNTISGTSMATPHVVGASALFLGANPDAAPADVAEALTGNALDGAVQGVPDGTANLLLNIGFLNG